MDTSSLFNSDLVRTLAEAQAALAALEKEKDELSDALLALQQELAVARKEAEFFMRQLLIMRREMFASRAEKRAVDTSVFQSVLPWFTPPTRTPETPATELISFERRAEGAHTPAKLTRSERFPEWLRRVVVEVDPQTTCCAECGNDNQHVIRYVETEKLCSARDPFYVKVYRRPVLGCRDCDTAAPAAPIEEVFERRSIEETVAADIVVEKFLFGKPLHRQQRRFTDIGIRFSTDALIDWVLQTAILVQPVYEAQYRSVLSSSWALADETRLLIGHKVPHALREFKRGALWAILGQEHEVVYKATRGRTHAECKKVLEGFKGTLLVDGADCFEAVAQRSGVPLAHCNNHARRGFVRAELSNPIEAAQALAFYHALYQVERQIVSSSPEERLEARQTYTVPVLEQFRSWLAVTLTNALPNTPLHKACSYVVRRWETLTRYTTDGALDIDTNRLETLIRTVAIGRKNFLHCASETGADAAAVLFSLLITCRLHDIDPFLYLADVMRRVAEHPSSLVHQLTPRLWKNLFLADAQNRYLSPLPRHDSS